MDLVKASATKPTAAVDATQRTDRKTKPEAKPEAVAAKKAEEQTPPRATTNTRGEMLGQLLNVRA